MSAQARPKTDPGTEPGQASAPVDDGWALLEGLRRRLDDQGAQTRKTQAQVTQLAESIAALVEAGRKRSRWLNINSFVAYLIFTILLGGAFYFTYQSRAHELVAKRDKALIERDRAISDRDAAQKRADDATQKLAAEQAASAKAAEAAAIDASIKAAQAAIHAGHVGEVIAPLEKALASEPAGTRAAEMHYLLGVAYVAKNQLDKAIPHLQAAVDGDVGDDDARFQLASALDRAGQWARARGEYDKFATAHPQSSSAVFAMRRSATLARMPATAPWNGPAKPAAPPGAAAENPASAAAPPKPAVTPAKPAAPPAAKAAAPAASPAAKEAAPAAPTAEPSGSAASATP
jgi:tetratricopeptide (TPR) repeat protein